MAIEKSNPGGSNIVNSVFGFSPFAAGPFEADIHQSVYITASTYVYIYNQINFDSTNPANNIWDTKQGYAKGFTRAGAVQDAHPNYLEVSLASSVGHVIPTADSAANVDSLTASFGFHNEFNIKANGYAPIRTENGLVGYFNIKPMADSLSKSYTAFVANQFTYVTPVAGASPVYEIPSVMTAGNGVSSPWGVKNPTDEELITLILQARKRRVLTPNKLNGIRLK